jgi:hypothetical protein
LPALQPDAPRARVCVSAPPAAPLAVIVSFVMRSSLLAQLPLKYPPRQAEYFYFWSKKLH